MSESNNVLPFPSALANVGAAPDIPNIHNMLTNIGHRVGHQSGLDESSGQNPAVILKGFRFRVYCVFLPNR